MDVLGAFEEERAPVPHPALVADGASEERVVLVFYPPADGPGSLEEFRALLPDTFDGPGVLEVETRSVSRDWVEGWRAHFRPMIIGRVRVRPPWEEPLSRSTSGPDAGALVDAGPLIEVVINPGLGFGTGLHPTTRGTLTLLQEGSAAALEGSPTSPVGSLGPLTDVGTGSGILAIAAAKLGWGPVIALDNDPVALISARENVVANDAQTEIEIHEADTDSAQEAWFDGATVLANMTLEPVSLLLRRLATLTALPRRLVVSGILAGSQEEQIMFVARESGFAPERRLYEGEWVSFELVPEQAKF